MAADAQPLRLVVLTAAATALGTIMIEKLLPAVSTAVYDWFVREPVLVIVVKDENTPISDVRVAVTSAKSPEVFGSGRTEKNGILRVFNVRELLVSVEADLDEGPYLRKYTKVHRLESLPTSLELDKKDFSRPLPREADASGGASAAPVPVVQPGAHELQQFRYATPVLPQDRRVAAVLEIDWEDGLAVPAALSAKTSSGTVDVVGLLREVGVDLEVKWSDRLSAADSGGDGRFSNEELEATMSKRRNAGSAEGVWHFYVILAGRSDMTGLGSMMFDTHRRGAVVFLNDGGTDPRRIVTEIVHEIGHMMNIPHPWQTYGDTRSVMTYPWRWKDWSYDDPTVYRFDKFAVEHIRRAPEKYVKPGASQFLDYGAPQKWAENSTASN